MRSALLSSTGIDGLNLEVDRVVFNLKAMAVIRTLSTCRALVVLPGDNSLYPGGQRILALSTECALTLRLGWAKMLYCC